MRKIFVSLFILAIFSSCAFAADSDKVLAKVNGTDITESEALEFIQPFGQQAIMFYGTEQGRKMIIEDLISMRLYALDAEKQGLDKTPEFQAQYENARQTLMKQLENARKAMMAQAAMKKVIENITVSDDEALAFYEEHKNEFLEPEKVHARHILVSDDENLAKVSEELKAGLSFDEAAKKYSIDPGSAIHGGDLGEFPRGVMVPEFEKTAFELKNPGDVSEPVKTQFGWHIIKLEEKIPEKIIPFEQVKTEVLQEVKDHKAQEFLNNRAKELEEIYHVERF